MNPPFLQKLRKETVAQLLKIRPETGLTKEQINSAFQELAKNTLSRTPGPKPLRSKEILRFELKTHMSEKNGAPETVFEKFLAREAKAMAKSSQTGKWANQIPIWSGVCGSGERKVSIDIGYSPGAGKFSLYELKIGSDHPLYAVVELITYALGYFVVRKLAQEEKWSREAERIRSRDGGLLDAKVGSFSVLAPKEFYDRPVRGKIKLYRTEMENIRACAEEFLTGVTKRCFGPDCLQIDFSLREIPMKEVTCPRDLNGRNNWIERVRGSVTLRELVLQAKPIL